MSKTMFVSGLARLSLSLTIPSTIYLFQSSVVTRSAWSWASCPLHLFVSQSFTILLLTVLAHFDLSVLPSSWLEYWCSSLWIWLSPPPPKPPDPRSAESDSRHKYLGASERQRERWSRLKRTELLDRVSTLWWKSMRLDRTQHVSSEEAGHYVIRTDFVFSYLCQSFSENEHVDDSRMSIVIIF